MGRFARLVGTMGLLVAGAVACGAPAVETGPAPSPAPSLGALVATYTRYGAGPSDVDVEITYTPADFYGALGQDVPADVQASGAAVFLARESVHEDDLPASPEIVLRTADGSLRRPLVTTVITDGIHHRSTRLAFQVDDLTADSVALVVLGRDGAVVAGGEFTWKLAALPGGGRVADPKVTR